MRRRSFAGRASRSLTAEGLVGILSLATASQVLEDRLEVEVRLLCPSADGREVLGILGEGLPNRMAYDVRHGLVRFRGFHAKRSVQVGIKIDGGASCLGHEMEYSIATLRGRNE